MAVSALNDFTVGRDQVGKQVWGERSCFGLSSKSREGHTRGKQNKTKEKNKKPKTHTTPPPPHTHHLFAGIWIFWTRGPSSWGLLRGSKQWLSVGIACVCMCVSACVSVCLHVFICVWICVNVCGCWPCVGRSRKDSGKPKVICLQACNAWVQQECSRKV